MDNKDTMLHDHCRGYLPHIENKQYQMITFRLYDSVPKEVVEGWKETLSLLGSLTSSQREQQEQTSCLLEQEQATGLRPPRRHPFSTYKTEADRLLALLDKYEDAGYGNCVLKNDNVAKIVHDAIFFYHGKKYNVISWCIMPNHVHVLIEVMKNISLSSILHSWRSFSSNEINKVLNRSGRLWMPEYFDRYIRDNDHFNNVVDYIHNNPVKAGLVDDPTKYKWSSAGYANFSPTVCHKQDACEPSGEKKFATPTNNQPSNTNTKI